jgi:hypothetical protein
MYGWEIDDNGMLVEITNGVARNFAFLYEVKGDKEPRRGIFYNCTAGKPSAEHSTIEESVEVKTQSMAMTMTSITVSERNVCKATISKSENETEYNNFFSSVVKTTFTNPSEPIPTI